MTIHVVDTILSPPDSKEWPTLYIRGSEGLLKQVNALLSRLSLSENAVAMVVEADGKLIGVSRGAHMKTLAAGQHERLNARESPDALVAAAFNEVRRSSADVDHCA